MLQLSQLSDYAVSPELGFLPSSPPLHSLPAYFSPWDDLSCRVPQLIASKTLRAEVAKLPLLSANRLSSEAEFHRAFVVLGFLVHAHIWCDGSDKPEPNVWPQLAEPYVQVCDRLGIQPTLTYAGLCLWNWKIRSEDGVNTDSLNGSRHQGVGTLDDLDSLVTFTGTRDEAVL